MATVVLRDVRKSFGTVDVIRGVSLTIEGTSLARAGEPIELEIAPGVVHVFDADGKAFPRTVDALPGAERRAS